jgi:hypothetical protein
VTFSVLHTTARPNEWQKAYNAWVARASTFTDPELFEYVLCIDRRWGFTHSGECQSYMRPQDKVVWNEGPQTAVSGWNTAAAASIGDVLLVSADDFYPPQDWDKQLIDAIWPHVEKGFVNFAVRVSSGVPEADNQGHICHAFLSRERYEHQGRVVYHPEYRGVFCDNDFTAHAEQDGAIIEARHIQFLHDHPMYRPGGVANCDEAFWHHNKPEDYDFGRKVFEKRRHERFGHGAVVQAIDGSTVAERAPCIAVCFAGEQFHRDVAFGLVNLNLHLKARGFDIHDRNEFTTNVYISRMSMARSVLEIPAEQRPDFVLWLDDDNILTPEKFDRLLYHALGNPQWGAVGAWCWIWGVESKKFYPSCGTFQEDELHLTSFDGMIFPRETEPRKVDWTGFPALLMRIGVLEKLGWKAFLPILDERLEWGMSGEDTAFCRRALDLGIPIYIDPQVKIPHLKTCPVEPEWTLISTKDPSIVGMIRAKNEARWIARSVKSLLEVCSEVYLMNDHSTDGTPDIARELGVKVLDTPFPENSMNPDESRDKAWLVEQIQKNRDGILPDWIVCIDGDEELEPHCKDKLLFAMKYADVEALALPFYHLWNRPDQIRVDRWYTTFQRFSMFKPKAGFGWHSLYQGSQVHGGLHTGNAPADLKGALLDVHVIHYGYMLKEDRIRKFRYYNSVDPNNPMEDGYRHCVQGDIPEVPPHLVLKHAGPLQLRPLPAHLVPDIDPRSLRPLEEMAV